MDSQTLEKVGMKLRSSIFLVGLGVLGVACSAKFLKYEKSEDLKKNKEFEQSVQIVEVPQTGADGEALTPAPEVGPSATPAEPNQSEKSESKKSKTAKKVPAPKAKASKKKGSTSEPTAPAAPTRRQPELESDIGFEGRRPVKDPFRVGEKVTHSVNYFKMKAGTLVLETRPFAMVNGRKNYQFRTSIKTASIFDSFYSVDDYVDVLMDFEQMISSVFTLHVKESAQLKEAQMLFDHDKHQATYWEKKVTEKNGEENKKLQWEISEYAQSVFSAAFYMRVFQWEVGKENAFHVADDEKNLIFRAKAIRKEKISTDAGDFDAIVIRPEIELKGKFNPVGDNYIWLSDDDRKYILRIESKIKIGTMVSEVVQIVPGK